MRTSGILRSLGTQPLPLPARVTSGLPPSGNVLEMEAWQPKSFDTLLQRQSKWLPPTAPTSQRTTVDVLGSLPLPEESAQVSVRKTKEVKGLFHVVGKICSISLRRTS